MSDDFGRRAEEAGGGSALAEDVRLLLAEVERLNRLNENQAETIRGQERIIMRMDEALQDELAIARDCGREKERKALEAIIVDVREHETAVCSSVNTWRFCCDEMLDRLAARAKLNV